MPTTRQGLVSAAIKQLIAQHVANAMTAYEANQNSGNGVNNKTSGSARGQKEPLAYLDGLKRWIGLDAAYETTWKELKQIMIDKYCPKNKELALLCPIMVTPEYKKSERYIWGLTNDIQGNATSSKPTKIQESIRMAHDLMDQVVRSKAAKGGDNKMKSADRSFVSTVFSPLINIASTTLDIFLERLEVSDGVQLLQSPADPVLGYVALAHF
ncbi:hypothetical protein Tco_0421472 [Tanacetum coccineum]